MYKCIKGFSIEVCDGDGFTIENEYMSINKGSIWNIPENKDYRLIGGEVRLENDEMGWIEITKEHLEEHFKLISESEEGKLDKEIDRLYSKIKDGAMEQNSTELFTYIWLAELRDRRKSENSVFEVSKLFKDKECIVLRKQYENGEISEEETLEIDEVIYSEYFQSKVLKVDYSIDLVKSCETTIEVTPILVVKY